MKKSILAFLAALLLLPLAATAQPAVSESAVEQRQVKFQQMMKDNSSDLRMLCVAAHPDDEDGATLAYHRYKYGITTHVLVCTRGEGGQNEIGPELYEDLAVIRTQEMQAAAKIEGAQLHFLDMPEFGFSKSLEETLEVWGEDELLQRMVRVIRQVRPHVIITHHGKMKDHGHHQAVGWAVQKAFDLAGDADYALKPRPGIYPTVAHAEVEPWQAQRLYIRDFTGSIESTIEIDISETDDFRRETYAEMHANALRAHESQGMGFIIDRLLNGNPKAYYELVSSADVDPEKFKTSSKDYGPLFEGIRFAESRPELLDVLRKWRESKTLDTNLFLLDDRGEQILRRPIFDVGTEFLELVFDYDARFVVGDRVAVHGQSVDLAVIESGPKHDLLKVASEARLFDWFRAGVNGSKIVKVHDSKDMRRTAFPIPADAPYTIPRARHLRDEDEGKIMAYVQLSCDKYDFKVGGPHMMTDHIDVAPPVLPEFLDGPYLLRQGVASEVSVPVRLTNYTPGPHTQTVSIGAPEGWVVEPASVEMDFAREDEQKVITLTVRAPEGVAPGEYALTADTDQLGYTEESKVAVIDFAPPPGDPLIGLIDSYDVQFRSAMDKMGVRWEAITEQDFSPERLDRYDLILVDMRSYLYRPDLKANNAAVLEYVKRGGTMIVNYHKTFDWVADYAPYRLVVANNRVTREDAPVTQLVPEHPVWNVPNAIGPADWEGWRQERGLYFAGEWDDAYTPLAEMTDPGEHIPPGSMLIADYGEGKYLYTALVWYRQLRELNPGAVRIFANMLAL